MQVQTGPGPQAPELLQQLGERSQDHKCHTRRTTALKAATSAGRRRCLWNLCMVTVTLQPLGPVLNPGVPAPVPGGQWAALGKARSAPRPRGPSKWPQRELALEKHWSWSCHRTGWGLGLSRQSPGCAGQEGPVGGVATPCRCQGRAAEMHDHCPGQEVTAGCLEERRGT